VHIFELFQLASFGRKLNFKIHLINLAIGCLCLDQVDGNAMEMFLCLVCFGTACGNNMFAVATVTIIYRSLGRQRLGLSLFFFDVYDFQAKLHNYILHKLHDYITSYLALLLSPN
jgi:hypothetical protein